MTLAVLGHHQRIDFKQAHVLGEEGVVERLHDQRRICLASSPFSPSAAAMFSCRHRANSPPPDRPGRSWIFSGVLCATSSMSMPPSVEAMKATRRGRAVDQGGKIKLARDRRAVLDIEPLDHAALRAGLMGHQRHAQHALGFLLHVLDGFHHLDAAALAAPAGMDLRLHHPDRAGQAPWRPQPLLRRVKAAMPRGHRRAEGAQNLFGLIFVNVHGWTLMGAECAHECLGHAAE